MKRHNVAEIFKKYRRHLFSFIRYRTSEDEAEDILQDVFLRFIQADNVSPINQVSSWLFQTARNKIIDNGRKCKEERMPEIVIQQDGDTFMQQVTDFLIDEEQSPEKEYLKSVVWEELEKALYELPEEQRYVFEQTELNGLTFIEFSEMCKTPVNTLISRKHYAVRYLRKRLKNIYESLIYEE